MFLYAATIFLSAFLLFLVQPLIAKQIVPWFGGSSAVWTTCLVFFQFLLLAGYAYSDWITRRLGPRLQSIVHVVLLAASLVSLPIVAGAAWKPVGDEEPTWRILGLLAATIGLPYFLLSTTGPLVQAWFARAFPLATVYRLFALSNLASLIALVSYPFAIEPWISTLGQAYAWSAGYATFVLLCGVTALYSLRNHAPVAAAAPDDAPRPGWRDYATWLALPAMGSWMLLAVTNHITQNIASIPFLWLLPLTLYLLSFIVCFDHERWYRRVFFVAPTLIVLVACAYGLNNNNLSLDIDTAIPLYAGGLFLVCMFCHGELAMLKPAPRHLTAYYLMISLGGAVGGLLVGVVAPRVFESYLELGIGLTVCALLAALVLRKLLPVVPLIALVAAGACGYYAYKESADQRRYVRVQVRNFYGTLRTKDTGAIDEPDSMRRLVHGVIMHGEQYLDPERRRQPTSYYGPASGVGVALGLLAGPHRKVGVIGLGTGTIAAYGKSGDVFRFYDINPQVIDLARREFWFLGDSAAKIETALGDARLNLEREPSQQFDLLAVDAFSSDAIPVHLLTREAMAVYLKHMKPGGVIAFHVTNRFLKLAPVVKQIAEAYQLGSVLIIDESEEPGQSKSDWVLVSRNAALLARPEIAKAASEIDAIAGLRMWTDDYNNLFQILK